jgi:hypothetical protein
MAMTPSGRRNARISVPGRSGAVEPTCPRGAGAPIARSATRCSLVIVGPNGSKAGSAAPVDRSAAGWPGAWMVRPEDSAFGATRRLRDIDRGSRTAQPSE